MSDYNFYDGAKASNAVPNHFISGMQSATKASAPPSGIGADLNGLLAMARRIRNIANSLSGRIEIKPTNGNVGLQPDTLPPTNLRSGLDQLNIILNEAEGYLINIENSLGSL